MPTFTFEDSTLEKALEKAEEELGIKRADFRHEILEEKEKGLLGMKWGKSCRISVTTGEKKKEDEAVSSAPVKASAILERILELSGFQARVDIESSEEEICLEVKIPKDQESLFIGRKGKNIDAFQHIAGKILEKELDDKAIRVTVDCARYRKRRKDTLIGMARKAADELKAGGRTYTFPSMQAADRRVIHMFMKEEGFFTESRGMGEEKRVVASIVNPA